MPGRSCIKIKLAFIHHIDGEITKRFPDYKELIRIVGLSKFKTENVWSRAQDAIIDTGAFTSLLPMSIWESLQVSILGDYFVRGLIPKKECLLKVKIGFVTRMILVEEGSHTPDIRFRCYLALSDEIPIILGFKDLLDKFVLYIDTPNQDAFLSI